MNIPRRVRREVLRRTATAKRKGRMKYIKFDEEFLSPNGYIILIDEPDSKTQREYAEANYAKAVAAVDADREQGITNRMVQAIPLKVEATFPTAMDWFLNNLPWTFEKLTDAQEAQVAKGERQRRRREVDIKEGGAAFAVIVAISEAHGGYFELEDAVYDQLIKTVETDAVEAFTPPIAGMLLKRLAVAAVDADPRKPAKAGKNGANEESKEPQEAQT